MAIKKECKTPKIVVINYKSQHWHVKILELKHKNLKTPNKSKCNCCKLQIWHFTWHLKTKILNWYMTIYTKPNQLQNATTTTTFNWTLPWNMKKTNLKIIWIWLQPYYNYCLDVISIHKP
jgi:hypothetical protein